jgi:archaellum biogenesis protein FlaJ (TadC family)
LWLSTHHLPLKEYFHLLFILVSQSYQANFLSYFASLRVSLHKYGSGFGSLPFYAPFMTISPLALGSSAGVNSFWAWMGIDLVRYQVS